MIIHPIVMLTFACKLYLFSRLKLIFVILIFFPRITIFSHENFLFLSVKIQREYLYNFYFKQKYF